jgi:hypothetical protein
MAPFGQKPYGVANGSGFDGGHGASRTVMKEMIFYAPVWLMAIRNATHRNKKGRLQRP